MSKHNVEYCHQSDFGVSWYICGMSSLKPEHDIWYCNSIKLKTPANKKKLDQSIMLVFEAVSASCISQSPGAKEGTFTAK